VALAGVPRLAGLAALALAAGIVAYLRPGFLPALVALALPGGQATVVLGVQVAPLDAVAGGGAIGYLILAAQTPSMRVMRLPHWLYAGFLACVALSALGPADDTERLRTAIVFGALGVVFHALTTRLDDPRARRFLLVGLAAATLLEAVLALYEYADRWSDRFAERDGAIVYPLPQGTLTHPNALAQLLVLGALIVAALAFSEDGRGRRLALAVAGLSAVALLVTVSRGAWIAFAAGVAVYALDRRLRRRVLVAGCAVLAACALLAVASDGAIGARITSLFDRDTSALSNFRVELAERGARIAADHPLTGVGVFHEVGVYAGRPTIATHPHDLLIGVAVFFGIPAAVVFAAIVVTALRSGWRRSREWSLTALGCLAAVVALLVNGLFEYPFWSAPLTALVVVVLGTAVGTTPISRDGSGLPSTE
jgi:O-antigen ligase